VSGDGNTKDNGLVSAPAPRARAVLLALLLACAATVVAVALLQGGTGAGSGPTPAGLTSPGAGLTGATAEGPATAAPAATPQSGLDTIAEAQLPAEALETLELIRDGGPFPFRQDDATFFNREGILPDRPTGYYREYTVVTPGSPDRGARRIVAGADGDRYYTEDHYDSFRQIAEGR
jgi:ribonuclease T1